MCRWVGWGLRLEHLLHILCIFVLFQPVHSCIEPFLHRLDFLLEIYFSLYILWKSFFPSFEMLAKTVSSHCTIILLLNTIFSPNSKMGFTTLNGPFESHYFEEVCCSPLVSIQVNPAVCSCLHGDFLLGQPTSQCWLEFGLESWMQLFTRTCWSEYMNWIQSGSMCFVIAVIIV